MRKHSIAVLAGCAIVALTVGTSGIQALSKSSGIKTDVAGAGISLALGNCDMESEEEQAVLAALIRETVMMPADAQTVLDNKNQTGNVQTGSVESVEIEETEKTEATEETTTEAPATETPTEETTTEAPTEEETTKEPSFYDTIAMSQVDNYVNVRTAPNTDSEIVGKIYNNCAATIVGVEGDWYKIVSGNCEGYIKAEFFVTGEEAEAVAIQSRNVYAKVTTPVLNVRAGQGTDSELLTQLQEGSKCDVIQYGDGWVYIDVDTDIQGWVSMDYVDISVEFDTAITLEEERAKLEEERRRAEEAARAEEEARKAAEAERIAREQREAEEAQRREQEEQQRQEQAQQQQQQADQAAQDALNSNSDSATAMRNAIVAYALQFVGNPYVYGGTSLTNGTDCSGFTKSVYAHFGYTLNRTSRDQSANGVSVGIYDVIPGDLLFYSNGGRGIGHVALYIGNGQIVHAATPSQGICVGNAYYRTPICARRVIN